MDDTSVPAPTTMISPYAQLPSMMDDYYAQFGPGNQAALANLQAAQVASQNTGLPTWAWLGLGVLFLYMVA